MNEVIDLYEFCCADYSSRYDFSQPFVFEGFKWASDGIIMVRVPAADENRAVPKDGMKFVNPWTVWHRFQKDGAFVEFKPEPFAVVKCWACRSGKCSCESCELEEIRDDCQCCNGFARVWFPLTTSVGSATINTRYADLISKLPNPMIVMPKDAEKTNAISFRFGGGEGLLMPLDMSRSCD